MRLWTGMTASARRMAALLLACWLCTAANGQKEDGTWVEDRALVDAKINGKAVRLMFDTGASHSVLYRPAAVRLGLSIGEAPSNLKTGGNVKPSGITEPFELAFAGKTFKDEKSLVLDLPAGIVAREDGVLGWLALRENVFVFDGAKQRIQIGGAVPPEALAWPRFKLRDNNWGLRIEVPMADGRTGVLFVDTGSSYGMELNAKRWREWTASHLNQPMTLTASYGPAYGLLVKRETWAAELPVGPIVLEGVPIMEAAAGLESWIPDFEAQVGLHALRRLDMVVDGNNGVAYLRPLKTTAPSYRHNRTGAVFVPKDMRSEPLAAHVVEGSPAYEAGIRDGDILLKIDTLDATKWRTDPNVMPLTRFWERPAGTKLALTLKRAEKEYQTTITLKDIIGPGRVIRDN